MISECGNVKVKVRNLSMIFGERPEEALQYLKEGLTKDEIFERTGQIVGVYDASFDVAKGEIFVLMGLSGSGKSTLLRCINRLFEPAAGEVIIDGENALEMTPQRLREVRRTKLGMVFQNFALFPHRTIIENVAYGLEVRGVPEKERLAKAAEVLKLVGLEGHEDSHPSQLSGGMQQRVGLARGLASDPDILLMDEAFSALDPLIRREMQDELLDLQDKVNKTIIFVSHDLDEALHIGDRIALMKDGEIIQTGTGEEILTKPADEYVAKFVAGVNMAKVLTAEGVMKRPEPVIFVDSSPESALKRMRKYRKNFAFVTNKNEEFRGVLREQEAKEAAESGKRVEEVFFLDTPVLSPETPVTELISIVAGGTHPLPVVDDRRILVGMIGQTALLDALTPGVTENGVA
ncbi:MAG TPA: glycine betaine/L-proline ABC transporter ATP-binding protein [Methanotrichaceae archaeon]|nr:glycine betaine/L-proline ABC transporter ATP-binding protein [Methanotrichaceae archaeon]